MQACFCHRGPGRAGGKDTLTPVVDSDWCCRDHHRNVLFRRRYPVARSAPEVPTARQSEDERLQSLGYKPQLNRVLGLFANFSVAFTYLSPMVGIYSLFALGVRWRGRA